MRINPALSRAYLSADPRSLALGRVALAVMLLCDLARRGADLGTWYTNKGLLPNHTVLWSAPFEWTFSFFFMASWRYEALMGFAFCGIAYLMLLLGVRTRLAHVFSALCVLSLHGRVLFIQNSGDVVLVELCIWTAFLPTGRRYSFDSMRARLRMHAEDSADGLKDRTAFAPAGDAVVSLAVLAVTAQLAIIYLFNCISKSGPTWRHGTVVHYMLHQDQIVTALGVWVRGWLTPLQSRIATYSALIIEAVLPLALLSPFARRSSRHIAIVLVLMLHGGFALFLNLGIFVPAMIAFTPYLIPEADWDALGKWWKRRCRRLEVRFDRDCGVCFQLMRILARLDAAESLDLVATAFGSPRGSDTSNGCIIALDPATGQRWLRGAAVVQIARTFPFGFLVSWPLLIPGLRWFADRAYDALARRRAAISVVLGLTACGSRTRKDSQHPELHRATRATPARRVVFGIIPLRPAILRETAAALLMILTTFQVLIDNPSITHIPYQVEPQWVTAVMVYAQFLQTWGLYAPDAPTTDTNIFVDAVTVDGRHVDPFNELASPHQPRPGPRIPPRLGQNALFANYVLRLPYRGDYLQAFQEWILRYPERTGRENDKLASFQAFQVTDESPLPGQREAHDARTYLLIKYP